MVKAHRDSEEKPAPEFQLQKVRDKSLYMYKYTKQEEEKKEYQKKEKGDIGEISGTYVWAGI
jgi:hypothetical protein